MRKNAEKMDLSSRNRLLQVPAGSHRFWAHDPLPDQSHDPDVDPRRVTIPLAFTTDIDGQCCAMTDDDIRQAVATVDNEQQTTIDNNGQ